MEAQRQRALVTGASSGLGCELARVLAQRGVDLVIAARRKDRLESLADELRREHHVDVVVLPADLSTPDGPQQLFDAVQAANLSIDILINNAGFGYFGPFLSQSREQIHETIAVDVIAVTMLTYLFGKTMKQRKAAGIFCKFRRSRLWPPIPRYSVYSGAKVYLIAFAQALQHELRKCGVKISVVAPGFMSTEFHDVAHHERTTLMKMTNLPVHYTARKSNRRYVSRQATDHAGLVLSDRRIFFAVYAAANRRSPFRHDRRREEIGLRIN